jgi:hypothetical protein
MADTWDSLPSTTIRVKVPWDHSAHWLYVTIATQDGKPVWVQLTAGKAGQDLQQWLRTAGKLASIALELGADPNRVFRHFSGHTDAEVGHLPCQGGSTKSVCDGVWKAWKTYQGATTLAHGTHNAK